MPSDNLPARKRSKGNLRKKLWQRARIPRRLLLVLLFAPLLSLGVYAAAAHWLLSGPKLRALINTDPESLTLDYDEAASLWPGRVTIKNLRIRGSDHNVQWIIRLADAHVEYSVLALLKRTFRARRLRGTGLSFSLRNKLEPAEAKTADIAVLPGIPGFADPPLRTAEEQGTPPGDPWRVDVQTLFIDHFDEIWIDAYHYKGAARLEGGFFLRPGLLARIGPARVDFESGTVQVGRAPVGASVSGTVCAVFEPWEPFRVHGSEVWQKTSGEVKLDARFDRLQFLEHLVSSAGTHLEEGAGKTTIQGTIEHGIAKGGVRVAVHDGSVRLAKLTLRGDADLRLNIPGWNLMTGPLEISGSRIALSEVRSSGSDNSRRWWGSFQIPSGKIGSTTTARIEADTRDARPLLALLAAELPAWTRGLTSLDDFSATATVSLGSSLTRVRGLDAKGGSFHIQGRYLHDKTNREGAFLIESGFLSVGLELQPEATKIRILGAKKWFEDQRETSNESAAAALERTDPIPSPGEEPRPPVAQVGHRQEHVGAR
jgi:hypothetical protein